MNVKGDVYCVKASMVSAACDQSWSSRTRPLWAVFPGWWVLCAVIAAKSMGLLGKFNAVVVGAGQAIYEGRVGGAMLYGSRDLLFWAWAGASAWASGYALTTQQGTELSEILFVLLLGEPIRVFSKFELARTCPCKGLSSGRTGSV